MRRMYVAAAWLSAAALALVLRRCPPDGNAFYPRCPIRAYLHLQCPGCGATRAAAALLHGDVPQAMRANGLFVALLPLLLTYAALSAYRAWTGERFRWPELPSWVPATALAAAAVFTVARNLA